jgi:signal transduction histidine kinase
VLLRLHSYVLLTAAGAAAATLVVTLVPDLRFAYHAPGLHVALESIAGVVGLLAAYLMAGRFRRTGYPGDLVLAWALGLLALGNLFLGALPAAVQPGSRDSNVLVWSALATRLLGATGFAVAALLPRRALRDRRRAEIVCAGATAGALLAVGAGAWLLRDVLPAALEPGISPADSNRPLVAGHPAVMTAQTAALALFTLAAVGFTRIAWRWNDELYGWLAASAVLSAGARLHYALFPSLYSEWVYTGDAFRLAAYVVLLVGAAREIGLHWRGEAEAAVLEERRRMARDLHDGLAQELAFISGQTARLATADAAPLVLGQVSAAADRALGEARRAIAALTRPLDEPLEAVLAEIAEEVAARSGLEVDFEASAHVEVPPATREELARVVREALTNAARHSRASRVRVTVSNGRGLRVSIADDGVGFDPARLRPPDLSGGFGLRSMQERITGLGGSLRIGSAPGAGTEIEVILP